MTPVLVEPLSEQAYELLRQLEALHILRVVPAETPAAPPAALPPASGRAACRMTRLTVYMPTSSN